MRTITFYRQKRIDGGIRTGVEVGGNTVLSTFESGGGKHDPALLWYVDVLCEGRRLPKDSEEARDWLSLQKKNVRRLLDALAKKVVAGVDAGDWPVHQQGTFHGVKMRVSCSAVRRLEARKLTGILGDIAEHWEEYVGSLAAV
ncbi:MAG: hypothetical protein ABSB33_10375 [Tepidisphaeraceae bacterium]|jgi:hypothetical protein